MQQLRLLTVLDIRRRRVKWPHCEAISRSQCAVSCASLQKKLKLFRFGKFTHQEKREIGNRGASRKWHRSTYRGDWKLVGYRELKESTFPYQPLPNKLPLTNPCFTEKYYPVPTAVTVSPRKLNFR